MEGWQLGAATLALILGGAAAFSWAVLSSAPPANPAAEPPRDAKRATQEAKSAVMQWREAIEKQGREAEERRRQRDARAGLDVWLGIAIRHLMHLWPTMQYDDASRNMRDFLEDQIAAWPSPDWDWSPDAAKEAAVLFTQEYGEQFGANA